MRSLFWAAYFTALGFYIKQEHLDEEAIAWAKDVYGQLVRHTTEVVDDTRQHRRAIAKVRELKGEPA